MTDFSHLDALEGRYFRECERLSAAKTEREKAFRRREIASCEKEITNERKFLGLPIFDASDLSDDELLAELRA